MLNLFKKGDAYIWFTGVSLMFSLLMILGLLFLIASKGLGFFWPSEVIQVNQKDGRPYMGQFAGREKITTRGKEDKSDKYRIRLKVGNRDLYGYDFKWINEDKISGKEVPKNAIVLERREWGNMYGFLKEIKLQNGVVSGNSPSAFPTFQSLISEANGISSQIKKIEKGEIGKINHKIEKARLKIRGLKLRGNKDPTKLAKYKNIISEQESLYKGKEERLSALYSELEKNKVVVKTVDGKEKTLSLGAVVRAYQPNSMGFFSKVGFYFSKFWEFVSDDPREANTEGGIFPAIFGTIMMVLIMSIVVMPFGVLAALYLREYAKQGPLVRLVRICVNNLAGVPSIVFGVFGVGFFLYGVGGFVDKVFFSEALPNPTYGTGGILWASLTLALLTLPVVIVATEEGLAAVPRDIRAGSLALGATKFETICKIVIPSALPAILTGLILAIARAAGEVAPLMITGVVKLAPDLPIDSTFPFVHLERKFMHLGFHIYDVGFQSPNVEAAKPMVFTTAFLLILIVLILNLTAILVRNKLKKKYAFSSAV